MVARKIREASYSCQTNYRIIPAKLCMCRKVSVNQTQKDHGPSHGAKGRSESSYYSTLTACWNTTCRVCLVGALYIPILESV